MLGLCRTRPKIGYRAAEWCASKEPIAYLDALATMEARVTAIAQGHADELTWLLEHPALYTAGTSARDADLLTPDRFPVYRTGRGGQFTYHGPGQRVGYVMLDLNRRNPDVRAFVHGLEEWLIITLKRFGITGQRHADRVGVWVSRPGKGAARLDKIAAIGIRVRRWVTFHGVALNIDPDLDHFAGIVPCGVRDQGVTSLADLGVSTSMTEVDKAMRTAFEEVFGATR